MYVCSCVLAERASRQPCWLAQQHLAVSNMLSAERPPKVAVTAATAATALDERTCTTATLSSLPYGSNAWAATTYLVGQEYSEQKTANKSNCRPQLLALGTWMVGSHAPSALICLFAHLRKTCSIPRHFTLNSVRDACRSVKLIFIVPKNSVFSLSTLLPPPFVSSAPLPKSFRSLHSPWELNIHLIHPIDVVATTCWF